MSTAQIETVTSPADKAKLAIAAGLVVAALAAFYTLSARGALFQWGALLACLVLAVQGSVFNMPMPAGTPWALLAWVVLLGGGGWWFFRSMKSALGEAL